MALPMGLASRLRRWEFLICLLGGAEWCFLALRTLQQPSRSWLKGMTVFRPLSGEQMEQMVRPKWRGNPPEAAANSFSYLARLSDVSMQKAFAEQLQGVQEHAGLQPLPPCHWRAQVD